MLFGYVCIDQLYVGVDDENDSTVRRYLGVLSLFPRLVISRTVPSSNVHEHWSFWSHVTDSHPMTKWVNASKHSENIACVRLFRLVIVAIFKWLLLSRNKKSKLTTEQYKLTIHVIEILTWHYFFHRTYVLIKQNSVYSTCLKCYQIKAITIISWPRFTWLVKIGYHSTQSVQYQSPWT